MTTAIKTSTPVALVFDQDAAWTRNSVIQAFIDDGVNEHRALGFVDSMCANVHRLISAGEVAWFPSDRWLRRFHRSLVLGIPDNRGSEVGTAHRGLEELIVPPTTGLLRITHDMGTVGGLRYCTVAISYEHVSV